MRILVLLFGDIVQQQRIGKEIETLSRVGHQVIVLELPPQDYPKSISNRGYEIRPICLWTRRLPRNLLFWPLKFIEMTLRFLIYGSKMDAQIIHCVDRIPLFAAFMIACKCNVPYVYDSQEIHSEVESSANKPKWLWLWLERKLARRALYVIVTDHYRLDLTSKILDLDKSKMYVLMNLSSIPDMRLAGRSLRTDCPWQDGKIAIYAGAISPHRHIEDIITSLTFLPPYYHIALVGFGDQKYKLFLESLAQRLDVDDRLAILPPVQWSILPQYIASSDCAFAFYEKNSLNNYYCSPSKLFDALMAGLPVISSDNPLVVEVLLQNDVGVCIAKVSPKTIAEAIMLVLARTDLKAVKTRATALARAKYSWEAQEKDFLQFYTKVTAETKARPA